VSRSGFQSLAALYALVLLGAMLAASPLAAQPVPIELAELHDRLARAYSSNQPYRLEVTEHRAASSGESTHVGEQTAWYEVICSTAGDVRIDQTHPMQRAALNGMNGTLLRQGTLYQLSTGPRRAVMRGIPPPHASATVARRAPSLIPAQVLAAVEGDDRASASSDDASGTIVVEAPLQGLTFTFDAADLSLKQLVSRRPSGRITECLVEEFHSLNPFFTAGFPARARTTSHPPGKSGGDIHVAFEVFTLPKPIVPSPQLFEWQQYADELVDESEAISRHQQAVAPLQDGQSMRVDPKDWDANPDGVRLPLAQSRTRTAFLSLGIALLIGGVAWGIRRRFG